MLVGFVSDEWYLALADVAVVFESPLGRFSGRSDADGGVYVTAPPGEYDVTLAKAGYGSKRVRITTSSSEPYQFRLLSEGLMGYVWPKWSRAGETAEFRVHSPEAYHLELYRNGWTRELVRPLGWFDDHGPRSTSQLTPDGDYTQTGVKWNSIGYTLEFHPQKIVAPERSGLYYFHARTAKGQTFSFPWIVQPARPKAKVAVLCSNITWNAYNSFGGRSNYVNQDALPPRPVVHSRMDCKRYTEPHTWPYTETAAPLSFDRPELFNSIPDGAQITDMITGRLACGMAPAEWRLLGWLEREGFEYDLYSETELHFEKLLLDDYQVVILNTHPEYGSPEMYSQMKSWVHERGGKLMYLGGCGLLAECEFADEHTLLCRREEVHELRNESEAKLLGLAYSHGGYQSAAPYRVLQPDHWAFAGTNLKSNDLFGLSSLHERCPGGASGHELDKISPDSPANLVHLAKGENGGGQGADLVIYDTPSGGSVFSVGSLCWTLSLPIDAGVSQVTANVLRKFLAAK